MAYTSKREKNWDDSKSTSDLLLYCNRHRCSLIVHTDVQRGGELLREAVKPNIALYLVTQIFRRGGSGQEASENQRNTVGLRLAPLHNRSKSFFNHIFSTHEIRRYRHLIELMYRSWGVSFSILHQWKQNLTPRSYITVPSSLLILYINLTKYVTTDT